MRLSRRSLYASAVVYTLATILCNNQLTLADSSSSASASAQQSNGIIGSLNGGPISADARAGAQVDGAASSANSMTQSGYNGGSPSLSNSAGAAASVNGGNVVADSSASSQASGGLQAAGSSQAAASSMASVSLGSTTARPEGVLSVVKGIFKGGREIIKDAVGAGDHHDSSANASASANATAAGSISGGSSSASSSANSSTSSSANSSTSSSANSSTSSSAGSTSSGMQGSASSSAQASVSIEGSTTQRPEGLLGRVAEGARRILEPRRDGDSASASASANATASSSNNGGSASASSSSLSSDGDKKDERPISRVSKLVNKGTEMVQDTIHRIEDRAYGVSERVQNAANENIFKPMSTVSGSSTQLSQGQMTARASAVAQLRGEDRERYLVDQRRQQEKEIPRPGSMKQVISDAKARGIIPQNEDRSALRGNHADEKSVAVEIFDRAHEMAKIPVESALKPVDNMLGFEKDPLIRIYDNSHEMLRRPLGMIAKPVESVLNGAFKTSDEDKKESEKLLATASEQERREAKLKEERAKKEDRSVTGNIADKTLDLATKPIEIVLRPFDRMLGLAKNGQKNPMLRVLDALYSLTKKPLDAVAKPFEKILKKMGGCDQMYQVSLRFNTEDTDPQLFTRLADGALNIADRIMTRPMEMFMEPLNHALGYDEPGKKNPIVEAAHSLKNATKIGIELFTKPADRIIKEIADLGEYKSEAQQEIERKQRREDASRFVTALDRIHDLAQAPFDIVLRPVGFLTGVNRNGKKDPLLRAWDAVHDVIRTPAQVISKPVEDAIFGERPRRQNTVQAKAAAAVSIEPEHKNIITDNIKRMEKMAVRPIAVITSPLRKMILGEDNEKVGSDTEKNNREIQARARANASAGSGQANAMANASAGQVNAKIGGGSGKQPDKIMKTLEKMNNVMLKPLEVITQPLSDMLSPPNKQNEKRVEVKAQSQSQVQSSPQGGQTQKVTAQAQTQVKRN